MIELFLKAQSQIVIPAHTPLHAHQRAPAHPACAPYQRPYGTPAFFWVALDTKLNTTVPGFQKMPPEMKAVRKKAPCHVHGITNHGWYCKTRWQQGLSCGKGLCQHGKRRSDCNTCGRENTSPLLKINLWATRAKQGTTRLLELEKRRFRYSRS